MTNIQVSIISPFFPHYRTELFAELTASKNYTFEFVGNTENYVNAGIPGHDDPRVGTIRRLHTRRLPGGAVWQAGAVAHVFTTKSQVLIYTGDAHHLSTWVAAVVGRLRSKSVLFWTHGWRESEKGIKRIIRNTFYRIASGLLLYGHHGRRIALSEGFLPERLFIVFNSMGAPLTDRPHSIQRARDRSREQHWLIISRLIPERHFDEVIRQMQRLAQDGRTVRLTVVGGGRCRADLETLAIQTEVDVEFLGAVYDAAHTGQLLSSADICLSPGHVGLTAIHAMSFGCPVATHGDPDRQMPEFEAVTDNVTGVLYSYGDFEEMAERVWRFVATADGDETARACHQEISRRWTPEKQAERIIAAITTVQSGIRR